MNTCGYRLKYAVLHATSHAACFLFTLCFLLGIVLVIILVKASQTVIDMCPLYLVSGIYCAALVFLAYAAYDRLPRPTEENQRLISSEHVVIDLDVRTPRVDDIMDVE